MDSQAATNRTCGPCNVCCKVYAIDDPELKKPPGVLCGHCLPGAGCSIYQTRPKICREYFCGWLQLPNLDESWRPDLCNIFIELKPDPPEHYRHVLPDAPLAFKFTLLGDVKPDKLGELALSVASLVASDVPVIVAAAAPPNRFGPSILLNPALKSTAAEAGQPFMELFALALHTLLSTPPEQMAKYTAPESAAASA